MRSIFIAIMLTLLSSHSFAEGLNSSGRKGSCSKLDQSRAAQKEKGFRASIRTSWQETKATNRKMMKWINKVKFVTSLSSLRMLSHYSGWLREAFRSTYSNLLNQAYKAELITLPELKVHLKELGEQGVNLYFGRDNIVLKDSKFDSLSRARLKELKQSLLGRAELTPSESKQILRKINELGLNIQELEAIQAALPAVKNKQGIEDVLLYLLYSRGVKPKFKAEALELMPQIAEKELSNPKSQENTHLKKFAKGKLAAIKFEKKERVRQQKQVSKMSESEVLATKKSALEIVEENTKKRTDRYKMLFFGCRAKTVNVDRMAANKKLLYSMLGLETINGIGSFAVVHRGEPIDETYKKKLIMSLLVTLPWAVFRAKLTSASSVDAKWKMFTDYMMANVLAILPSLAYEQALGVNDKEIKERTQKLLEHPDFKNLLMKYIKILEENFGEELDNQTMPQIANLTPDQVARIVEGQSDLDETEEWLRTAIARELYDERRGSFDTGSVGMDYWVFGRAWGVNSSVRNIAIGLLMYHILCMGQLNPMQAYLISFGIFAINKILNEYLYLDLMYKATGI